MTIPTSSRNSVPTPPRVQEQSRRYCGQSYSSKLFNSMYFGVACNIKFANKVKFTTVAPVIIEHEVEFPVWPSRTMAPVHHVLLISTVDGRKLLLPMLVLVLGSRDAPSQRIPIRQWRGNIPEYDDVYRRFEQHPITRISDVLLAEALESSYRKDPWGRRRFSTTWDIAPTLSDMPMVYLWAPNNQHKAPGHLPSTRLRYASIPLPAAGIDELVPSVQI